MLYFEKNEFLTNTNPIKTAIAVLNQSFLGRVPLDSLSFWPAFDTCNQFSK